MFKLIAIATVMVLVALATPKTVAGENPSCTAVDPLLSEGAHSEAIQAINQCLSDSEPSAMSYGCLLLKRGRAYFEMGQTDKSGGAVGSAIGKDPDLNSPDRAAACLDVSTEDAASILDTASDD